MRSLLDVNVLLALFDADHADHRRARSWLEQEALAGWASCAITQNGFVRIISQERYPNRKTPAAAIARLAEATASGHHEFWPCDLTLLDANRVRREHVHGSRQTTDVYLLALAVSHRGRFVTLDRRIALAAVAGAREEHLAVV